MLTEDRRSNPNREIHRLQSLDMRSTLRQFVMRTSKLHLTILMLLLTAISNSYAASADLWRTRSIYQVMVDRFALTNGSTTTPCNVTTRAYCGGTWKGLQTQLDYIQGMGFDAVWISPISAGVTGMTADGADYTGYWVNDLTKLNDNFGTEEDLLALSEELHSRGRGPNE